MYIISCSVLEYNYYNCDNQKAIFHSLAVEYLIFFRSFEAVLSEFITAEGEINSLLLGLLFKGCSVKCSQNLVPM